MPGIAEAVAGAVQGIGNVGLGIYNAYQQNKNYAYQKNLQKEIFKREDTAIQRQVADAEAAGYNRFAVLGNSGAGAGSVVSTTAPQVDPGMAGSAVDALSSMYSLATQKNSAKTAAAQASIAENNKQISENQKDLSFASTALDMAKMMKAAGFDVRFQLKDGHLGTKFFHPSHYDEVNKSFVTDLTPDFDNTPLGKEFANYYKNVQSQAEILQTDAQYKELKYILGLIGQIFGAGQSAGSAYNFFKSRR